MLSLLRTARKPTIEFLCHPDDRGVIAEPVPARSVLPSWFKKLPAVDKAALSAKNNGLTVKRCMPFIDAMTTGWIIPLAATIRLEIRDAGCTVEAGWEIDRVMVSNHGMNQVAGNPREPRPPCKIHNYWTIKTPPGWSSLFVSPLNRHDPVIEIAAGIVDTDTYNSQIHFPFFAVADDGIHTIERGTPLVQVIPFKRDHTHLEGIVRVEAEQEAELRAQILRNTQASEGCIKHDNRSTRMPAAPWSPVIPNCTSSHTDRSKLRERRHPV